ncbi:transposase [Ruegeria lacuscaerulensis ITI-1157]|nr:transposase [Ruegeria lacuscaerulensis ITI-1157]
MHVNKVTVAPAAKLARAIWVMLGKPGATYEWRAPEGSCA